MSRINDELKRAKQVQRKDPLPSLAPLPPNEPKTGAPELPPVTPRPGNALGWILPGVIGILIVAASLFIGMALVTRTATKASGQPTLMAAQPAKSVAVPAPQTALPASAQPQPPATSPPPPPPGPKLQGIVYATTQPWAIVDGQTVHVGDRLGKFRVKEISPRNVTLERADGSLEKLGLDK